MIDVKNVTAIRPNAENFPPMLECDTLDGVQVGYAPANIDNTDG